MKSITLAIAMLLASTFVWAQSARQLPTNAALEPSVELTVFPHVTMGNGWKTSFVLFNVSDFATTYRLVFYDNDGLAKEIKMKDRDAASEYFGTLQPRASLRLETDSTDATSETQYWAALEEGSGAIAGTQTFEWSGPEGRKTSATVPISDDFTIDPIFVPFDNTNGSRTALVITNTDNLTTPEAHSIVIEGWDSDGNQFFSTTRSVESGDKPAFLLADEYPELANRKGVIRLDAEDSGTGDFAILALQADDQGNITAVLPFEGFF